MKIRNIQRKEQPTSDSVGEHNAHRAPERPTESNPPAMMPEAQWDSYEEFRRIQTTGLAWSTRIIFTPVSALGSVRAEARPQLQVLAKGTRLEVIYLVSRCTVSIL